jgi:diguanylate cyclase (GGDEF)-like protein
MSNNFIKRLAALEIPNIESPAQKYLTASIGLSGMVPDSEYDEGELISRADAMLYSAKKNGRNRVER